MLDRAQHGDKRCSAQNCVLAVKNVHGWNGMEWYGMYRLLVGRGAVMYGLGK